MIAKHQNSQDICQIAEQQEQRVRHSDAIEIGSLLVSPPRRYNHRTDRFESRFLMKIDQTREGTQ